MGKRWRTLREVLAASSARRCWSGLSPSVTTSGLRRTTRSSLCSTALLPSKPTTRWTMISTRLSETGTNYKVCLADVALSPLSPLFFCISFSSLLPEWIESSYKLRKKLEPLFLLRVWRDLFNKRISSIEQVIVEFLRKQVGSSRNKSAMMWYIQVQDTC